MSIEDEARAEAERHRGDVMAYAQMEGLSREGVAQAGYRMGYVAGASRPVSDEQIEAGCVGFYNDPRGLTSWKRLAEVDPVLADKYRAGMRKALEAARAAGS